MTDQINSPSHYTQGRFETIYEIADILGADGFKAFCLGNAIKYYSRAEHKGAYSDDLAKAVQYLNWHVNGLPEPINGRLPKTEGPQNPAGATDFGATQAYDPRYEEKMARHAAASKSGDPQRDLYESLAHIFDIPFAEHGPRTTSKPTILAAGYGADKPDPNKHPTAKAVSAALNPSFVAALGGTPVGYFLRVQRARCQEHEDHVWYIASVIRKEDNQPVIEMTILHAEPDEEVLHEAGIALAGLFQTFVS